MAEPISDDEFADEAHRDWRVDEAEKSARIADLEAQVAEMKAREEARMIALGQHANERRIALAQVAQLQEALERIVNLPASASRPPRSNLRPISVEELAAETRGALATFEACESIAKTALSSTAPAWAPTHRHYKGTLYRELMRVSGGGGEIVLYDDSDGVVTWLHRVVFDGQVVEQDARGGPIIDERRYAPLPSAAAQEPAGHQATGAWVTDVFRPLPPSEAAALQGVLGPARGKEPADPPWITWEGGEDAPVPGQRVHYRMRDGEESEALADELSWHHTGNVWDIVAYRIVREGGHVG